MFCFSSLYKALKWCFSSKKEFMTYPYIEVDDQHIYFLNANNFGGG